MGEWVIGTTIGDYIGTTIRIHSSIPYSDRLGLTAQFITQHGVPISLRRSRLHSATAIFNPCDGCTADAQDLLVCGSLGEPRTKDSELQTPPGTACAGSGGPTQFILMHVVVCSLEAGQPRFVWQCGTWLFVAKKLLRRPVAAFTFLGVGIQTSSERSHRPWSRASKHSNCRAFCANVTS